LFLTSGYSSEPFGFAFAALAAIILIAAWVILAASRFVQGGVVERPERVPQLYGYTVCLAALFWALSSATAIVENAMTLSAPAYHQANEYGFEPSVSSFEAFRLTYDRARELGRSDPSGTKLDTIPEAQLRQRFTAYRADRIAANEIAARQALITHTISLLLAAALFAFHWRWLRRRVAVMSSESDR
jgi:hypothetical protein